MRQPPATTDAIEAVGQAMIAEAKGELNAHPRVHLAAPGGAATERDGRCVRTLPAIGRALVRRFASTILGDPTVVMPGSGPEADKAQRHASAIVV